MSSLLARLFCCGVRPRAATSDAHSTVIPNEHSRLLDQPPSPAIVVDHQTLSDRLGTIVRAKEGKMVSVSARTPFTIHDAEQLPAALTSAAEGTGSGGHISLNRRPPVLTMTPARSQGSLHNMYSDASRHSSRSGSRSSSRPPALHLRSHSPHSTSSAPRSAASVLDCASVSEQRGAVPDASGWFGESGSEVSVEDKPPSPAEQQQTPTALTGITFDWDT
ncbi:hypothetical protein C8R47DRAFT_1168371 [Mycena vitilis]|nr:hypothetical protein C8R47DRAFT_1168371 [Mycena vitilis]